MNESISCPGTMCGMDGMSEMKRQKLCRKVFGLVCQRSMSMEMGMTDWMAEELRKTLAFKFAYSEVSVALTYLCVLSQANSKRLPVDWTVTTVVKK